MKYLLNCYDASSSIKHAHKRKCSEDKLPAFRSLGVALAAVAWNCLSVRDAEAVEGDFTSARLKQGMCNVHTFFQRVTQESEVYTRFCVNLWLIISQNKIKPVHRVINEHIYSLFKMLRFGLFCISLLFILLKYCWIILMGYCPYSTSHLYYEC